MLVLLDFQDRAVRFTEERLRHLAGLAEPEISLPRIKEALRQPDVMTEAFCHPALRLFYRIYTKMTAGERNFHVVVKVRGYDMLVVTAFFGRGLSWGQRRWTS